MKRQSKKARPTSPLRSTLAEERPSAWKLCSISTSKGRKAVWKTHLRGSRKEVSILLSSEEGLKTDMWVTRTTSCLLVVLLEGDSIHEQFQHASPCLALQVWSQTENFTQLLHPRLNLGRLLVHSSIQLLWLIQSVPDYLLRLQVGHGMAWP